MSDPVARRRARHVTAPDGLVLAVQERGRPAGDGPTVLLVHGYPDQHAVWDLVAARLEADHHVVTYDTRGAGASGAPPDRAGYRLPILARDVAAVAEAVAPRRAVHLVGHDWGSIEGWAAVTDADLADRFASFTSMSGPSLDHVGPWVRSRLHPRAGDLRVLGAQGVRSWYTVALRTPLGPLAWRRGLARRWPDAMRRREGALVDDRWPGPGLEGDAVRGVERYRANLGRAAARPEPTPTAIPVQLVIARRDAYVTPALLDGLEALAPDLTRHELDAGHWSPRSEPDQVAELIAAHVARVDGCRL